jgi:hypothetical protein
VTADVHLCLLTHVHGEHDWWYTSSGGGHMLDAYDESGLERNQKQWHCPGIEPEPEPITPSPSPDVRTRLAEMRGRVEGATDGPWEARTTGRSGGDHWYVLDGASSIASIHASDGEDEDQREPDATFIAHARTDLPALLDAVEAVLGAHRYRIADTGNTEWCDECQDGPWPCPTVRAITDALGGA